MVSRFWLAFPVCQFVKKVCITWVLQEGCPSAGNYVCAKRVCKYFINLQHFHFKKCNTTISVILQISFSFTCVLAAARSFSFFAFCSVATDFCQGIVKAVTAVTYQKLPSFVIYVASIFFLFHKKIPDAFIFRQLIIPRDQMFGWFTEKLTAFLMVVVCRVGTSFQILPFFLWSDSHYE